MKKNRMNQVMQFSIIFMVSLNMQFLRADDRQEFDRVLQEEIRKFENKARKLNGTIVDPKKNQEIGKKISKEDPKEVNVLDDRFKITATWTHGSQSGDGIVQLPLSSDDSVLFWFFDPDNSELLIKVLDGCKFNNHFWVFAAAATNVEYTLTVTDTQIGESKIYNNPLGNAAAAITDTDAFATCP